MTAEEFYLDDHYKGVFYSKDGSYEKQVFRFAEAYAEQRIKELEFQNDCKSGSEECLCYQKNGFPCYRHLSESDRIKELEEALEHIMEYWNRDRNDEAMFDALWHIVETAEQALNQ